MILPYYLSTTNYKKKQQQKTLDLINSNILWETLENYNIKGQYLNTLEYYNKTVRVL
jgi:hypothetical protein